MQRRETRERIRAALLDATMIVRDSRAMACDSARMAMDARSAVDAAQENLARATDRQWSTRRLTTS